MIVTIGLVFFYVLITGLKAASVRSAIMAAIILFRPYGRTETRPSEQSFRGGLSHSAGPHRTTFSIQGFQFLVLRGGGYPPARTNRLTRLARKKPLSTRSLFYQRSSAHHLPRDCWPEAARRFAVARGCIHRRALVRFASPFAGLLSPHLADTLCRPTWSPCRCLSASWRSECFPRAAA